MDTEEYELMLRFEKSEKMESTIGMARIKPVCVH